MGDVTLSYLRAKVGSALQDMGINLDDHNFKDTPERWAKFIREFLQPYDPERDLTTQFQKLDDVTDDSRYGHPLVVQSNIPFQAVCAHHLVPVLGRAFVGYVPSIRVVGLSKLTRLVHGLSHKSPSLQEDVTSQVVEALEKYLEPIGSMCVIQAEHGCMACRGVANIGTITSTSAIRGAFIKEHHLREEFYKLAGI